MKPCFKSAQQLQQELEERINGEDKNSEGSRLFFGVDILDWLLRGVLPGEVLFLYGSRACNKIVQRLCVKIAEIGSKVVFVDGANSLDPYHIATICQRNHYSKPESILSNILVARSFTCHQLASLLLDTLPKLVERENPALIVVTDVLSLYEEEELTKVEAQVVFKQVVDRVLEYAKSEGRSVVLTHSSLPVGFQKALFSLFIASKFDVIVRVTLDMKVGVLLEKHPAVPTFRLEVDREWREACPHLDNYL